LLRLVCRRGNLARRRFSNLLGSKLYGARESFPIASLNPFR
jgi:hypothetical protein